MRIKGLVVALLLALLVFLFPASAGAWTGGTYNTGCYQGTAEVHLWTYQAPMNGALVWFSSGYIGWYPGYDFGGGSWGVWAYGDGSVPVKYQMDWKYAGISGWVTVYCFA